MPMMKRIVTRPAKFVTRPWKMVEIPGPCQYLVKEFYPLALSITEEETFAT